MSFQFRSSSEGHPPQVAEVAVYVSDATASCWRDGEVREVFHSSWMSADAAERSSIAGEDTRSYGPFLIPGSNGVSVDLNFPPSSPKPEHFWALVEYIRATHGGEEDAEIRAKQRKRVRAYLDPLGEVAICNNKAGFVTLGRAEDEMKDVVQATEGEHAAYEEAKDSNGKRGEDSTSVIMIEESPQTVRVQRRSAGKAVAIERSAPQSAEPTGKLVNSANVQVHSLLVAFAAALEEEKFFAGEQTHRVVSACEYLPSGVYDLAFCELGTQLAPPPGTASARHVRLLDAIDMNKLFGVGMPRMCPLWHKRTNRRAGSACYVVDAAKVTYSYTTWRLKLAVHCHNESSQPFQRYSHKDVNSIASHA